MVSVKKSVDAVGLNAEILIPYGKVSYVMFYASQIKIYVFKVNFLFV
jgi:hypothetical protein